LDSFLGAQTHAEFLQSWEWGEFQEKVEGKILRLGVEENGELVAAATLVKKSLPMKMNYFYCPRGPVIREERREKRACPRTEDAAREEIFDFLFAEIKKIAKKEKVIFLRIEPHVIASAARSNLEIASSPVAGLLAMTRTIDIQPAKTIVLDLSKSEGELLSDMHQKTRYNIRLAEKKGVQIREAARGGFLAGDGEKELEKFWNLMQKTSGRDGFTPHNKNYYAQLLHVAPDKFKLFFAVLEDKTIAAGIFSFFGNMATYLFGASDDEYREVMAPHLLQWELIKRAKAGGYKYYDFFGIDEKKWPGVTRFKRGFAGQEINYTGTFDVIFDKQKYLAYKIFRRLRRFF